MKRILIIACLPLLMLFSCKKDITSLNVDPKNPTTVPSSSLFTNAQHNLINQLSTPNVNSGIFELIDQYWTETTYTDESNYDLNTRQIPQGVWNTLYRDVLKNLQQAKVVIPTDVSDATVQKNDIAITDIMQVYTWYYLVTTFGNIPYTEALDVDKTTAPKYDDQKTIYYDLLTRLDADIAALNTGSGSFGSADLVYQGSVSKWKKFANSFKLKMGMTISDFDDAKAKAVVESAVSGGVFTSNSDNAMLVYLSAPPNTNPIWVNLVQSGRKDFVGTSVFINLLKGVNDPRLPYYFTFNGTGTDYSGGAPGASSNYATFSKPSGPLLVAGSIGKVTNPDFPTIILGYDEVEFFLAEAVARGYNVGGTADTHYNNAITASILWWGGSAVQAAAYLAQPSVAYATAAGNYKQKIGTQKYLALYTRGWDEWIEVRRLDYPVLVAPSSALTAFPVRYTYPVNEQNLNTTNYNAAATAIGGDKVITKLFWDKF